MGAPNACSNRGIRLLNIANINIQDLVVFMIFTFACFGIEIISVAERGSNKVNVLDKIVARLKEEVADVAYEIGEPLYISDLFRVINLVPGVLDTIEVNLIPRIGGDYSDLDLVFIHDAETQQT